jgi:cyanuric acid amidohydrolase
MNSPGDVSGLEALLDSAVDPADVVAVIGKTEGTGLGHDPGRAAADTAISSVLAARLGIAPEDVGDRVSLVLSGGTPGVLSPHIAVVSARRADLPAGTGPSGDGRLAVGIARSRPILPEHIGRLPHVHAVADAVGAAVAAAGLPRPDDVHLVLVKAPALTEAALADAARRGRDTVTSDLGIGPNGGMCYANDASALGVACALGEIDGAALRDEHIRADFGLFSSVAMTSAAGERDHAEVIVFGNSPHAVGPLRIGHAPMKDILDLDAVHRALADAGLRARPRTGEFDRDQIVYLLAKMIIPGSRRLRGNRLTLADDPHGFHVAKAMGGYLLACTTGQTTSFASGGEHNSHQGPPDGNPLAAIVRIG